MQTADKDRWLDQVNRLFEARDYLRALDVILEAKKEFPGDGELEQLEGQAWRSIEKVAEVGQLASKVEREPLERTPERFLETNSLLDLIEGRRRERIVEGCLYQARWLQSQGEVARALRALDGGLTNFPHEARLVQLRDSLLIASEAVKIAIVEPSVPLEPVVELVESLSDSSIPQTTDESAPPSPEPSATPLELVQPAPAEMLTRPQMWSGFAGAALTILLIAIAVKLVAGREPSAVARPANQQAVLEINTSPASAVILVDGKERDKAAALLGIPLSAGLVQIEARLPGYQTARATANLHAGVRREIALTLTPTMAFQLLLPGDGEISVNNEEAVKVAGGTFSREFTPGTYAVRITTGKSGLLSFAFPVEAGGQTVLTSLPNARDVSGLLISSYGEQGRIYRTGPAVKIKLDGRTLGEVNEAGLDLPKLAAGKHELELGENRNLRKISAVFGPSRTLTAMIGSERSVEIQKGRDRKSRMGSVRIRVTAGAELFVDGNSVPMVADGTYTISDMKPGAHTFRAQKGKQFLPNQKAVEIVAGQNGEIDLKLSAAPIPVQIKRAPADSNVTYTRTGDPMVHTFGGNRQDLPEGDYTFTARANGYMDRIQNIHVSWDSAGPVDLAESAGIAEWRKGGWTQTRGWYSRKGGGIIYFPKALGTGSAEFALHWQGQGRAQWIVNASDRSYLQCELDDDGFQVFRVTDGKTPVPIGKKKLVAKMASYIIRIEVKPDTVVHKLQKDGAWELLDSLQDIAPAAGKFGFNIPNRQELFLANFALKPDR
ncbi:MAG TPA: hypothetical protein VG096_20185 [Bryobacteraceae bacterium]|jgi:hypothetical protein|nr:hypothetical protein [Bryobacteraceae bacterium]